ncbi:MAG: hypothetical protein HYR60_22695 [Acidobacteria bacterium]|nr:hypothetical protein [Acidobacteriota bacterium]
MAPREVKMGLFLLFCALAGAVQAGIWPEKLGGAQRTSVQPLILPDQKLWLEYGLEEAEQAAYALEGKTFQAQAVRLHDSTGAQAAFQWQRPQTARESDLSGLAAETAQGALVARGNYLLRFEGRIPEEQELAALVGVLPRLEQSQLPALTSYLPAANLAPGSLRYILGPVSLEKFEPRIPPSVAAFHVGAEAQFATYLAPGGDLKLGLFSYPTPAIARERLAEFQKLPGAVVKRTGPLVAVLLSPPNPDEAEKLLAQVRYQASITWSERVPSQRDNIGDLVVNIFLLTGILLAFAVVSGLAFGGFRALLFRRWTRLQEEPVIRLHLER